MSEFKVEESKELERFKHMCFIDGMIAIKRLKDMHGSKLTVEMIDSVIEDYKKCYKIY